MAKRRDEITSVDYLKRILTEEWVKNDRDSFKRMTEAWKGRAKMCAYAHGSHFNLS